MVLSRLRGVRRERVGAAWYGGAAMRSPFRALSLLFLLSVASCKSEPKPTASPAPSRSAKPAPTFPDFESLVMLDGRDAGLPPNADATDGGPATAAVAAGNAAGGSPALTLIEPGTEPRTVARYDFVPDKPLSTVATMRVSASGMGPGGGQQPPLKLTLQLTPKAKGSDSNVKFALRVTKAEISTGGAAVPPEAADEIKQAEAAMTPFRGASPRAHTARSATSTSAGVRRRRSFKSW